MVDSILNIKPEEDFLLKLYRLSFKDEDKSKIEVLVSNISDWDHFIWLANEHGIIALAFYNLEQLGLIDKIPESVQLTLKNLYLKSLSRNTFLLEKFIELKEILTEIGIKPVVLKGMALEPAVYGNKGLRQMNDIDIYIKEKDECLRAWKHLKNNGYHPKPTKSSLHNKLLLDYGKHLPDLNKDGISYDIHHRLFNNEYHINTIKVTTGQLNLIIPDYDIHFLYLVKHLYDHELTGGSQLRLYIDLLQIIIKTAINPASTSFIDLAEGLGLKSILFEKLFLLHLIWSIPIREDIFKQLSDAQKTKAVNMFLGFLRDSKGQTGINKGARYRETIRNIPTLSKKLIFLLGDIFPSLSFMQNRYKTRTRAGACFYYPLRLGKLLLLFIR